MTFTHEQQKVAYKKLSPEAQDFVMSDESSELIESCFKESGLSEKYSSSADSEILWSMLGLQTLSDAINNIAVLCGKSRSDFVKLEKDLEENIFDKIPKNINSVEKQVEEPKEIVQTKEEKPAESIPQNSVGPAPRSSSETGSGVGESFEQIILNQARAMTPARPADESGRIMNYESRIMNGKEEKPANLPTENNESKKEEPKAIHNYITEPDPYREPLE